MKVYIGADHRGFEYKAKIIAILNSLGYDPIDMGTDDPSKSCDYPKSAFDVASAVAKNKSSRGILVCMSGIGQSIAANKVKGAYAALCYTLEACRLSRQHNNANILVLSAKFTKVADLKTMIKTWLEEPFEGGRHKRRFDLIKKIEQGKM